MSGWFKWLADPRSNMAWLTVFAGLFFFSTWPLINDFPITYPWQELMLNYQGGFIRRGLLGEIALHCRPYAAEVLYVLIFSAYATTVFLFLKTIRSLQDPKAQLLLLLSPMLLMYPVIFPSVGLRKDIFVLLAFLIAMRTEKDRTAVLAMTLATFIHEEALFFMPMVVMKHRRTFFYFLIFGSVFVLFSAFPKEVADAVQDSWQADLGMPLKYITGQADPFVPAPKYALSEAEYADWFSFFKTRILPLSLFGLILTALPVVLSLPLRVLKTAKAAAIIPILLFLMPNWGRWENHLLFFWTVSVLLLGPSEKQPNLPNILFLFVLFCLYPYTDFIFKESGVLLFSIMPILVLFLLFVLYNLLRFSERIRQWIIFRRSDM